MKAVLDDSVILETPSKIEIIKPVGRRVITHVMHDIDGTHSLIRDWPPVMSLTIHWAMTCGLKEDFDSDENCKRLVERVGQQRLEETDRFCIESAGLSALTQMEYGIRRAVQIGNVPPDAGFKLTAEQRRNNAEIVQRIWHGQERFADIVEPPELLAFIHERTPRLFKLYEAILNKACRDRNTADAWKNPAKWLVPGSMEFMRHLHAIGCRNYFVTGAVIYPEGGMYEEVQAVGFEVGPGKMVDAVLGSSWDRKMPKVEVMRELCAKDDIDPACVLVLGDGRTEIEAAVQMGSVAISRLPAAATRQRELHIQIGTNYIVEDWTEPLLRELIRK
jgi:phosphoglycolate phosphatase-like HAD superfamily hydrolase